MMKMVNSRKQSTGKWPVSHRNHSKQELPPKIRQYDSRKVIVQPRSMMLRKMRKGA